MVFEITINRSIFIFYASLRWVGEERIEKRLKMGLDLRFALVFAGLVSCILATSIAPCPKGCRPGIIDKNRKLLEINLWTVMLYLHNLNGEMN